MFSYGSATQLLVNQLQNTEIYSYPFPHLVIHNFLPQKIYDQLAECFEDPLIRSQLAVDNLSSNKLFLASVLTGRLQSHLSDFLSDESIESLLFFGSNIFLDIILNRFLISSETIALGSGFTSSEASNQPIPLSYRPRHTLDFDLCKYGSDPTLYFDIQFGINSPAFGPPSSVRNIHIDHPAKLFNALLYFRHPSDCFSGGDLCLFRHRAKRSFYNENVLSSDAVLAKVVPYASNTLVLFLNGLDSLHGVVERSSTTVERRYINVLARFRNPFLDIKRAQGSRFRYSYIKDRCQRILSSL